MKICRTRHELLRVGVFAGICQGLAYLLYMLRASFLWCKFNNVLSLVELLLFHNYLKSCASYPNVTTSNMSLKHVNI